MSAQERAIAELQANGGKCINPKCRSKGPKKRKVFTCGVCRACDMAQRRAITAGKTTRERLEQTGARLPIGKQRQGRV